MAIWANGGSPLDAHAARIPDDPWETFKVAEITLPGIAKVEGRGRAARIDRKSAPGSNGATLTHNGVEPAEIDVTLLIWTEAQLTELQAAIQKLSPVKVPFPPKPLPPGEAQTRTTFGVISGGVSEEFVDASAIAAQQRSNAAYKVALEQHAEKVRKIAAANAPKPLDVHHPALALNGIRSLYVAEIGLLKPSAINGVREVTLKFVEFLRPSKDQNVTATPKESVNLARLEKQAPAPPRPSATNANP
jgi:hypothetical protein